MHAAETGALRVGWVAVLVMVALAPIWLVGTLRQSYWTPDEPREADIIWRMSFQADRSVPELAGTPILEKPPMYYWIGGAAVAAFGSQPWATRLPNLLYALVATTAVVFLAYRAAGVTGAWVAGLTAGSFVLAWQVAIWLATDAALVAAISVALLGMYMALRSPAGRYKFAWYLLMHVAIAFGFLTKSAMALIVPALTMITLVAWERRWKELLRWELWAGALAQIAIVVPWVFAVLKGEHGLEHLTTFFWWNLAGRFVELSAAPEGLDYAASGHRNRFGKYFLEAPLYLLPWTFLCVAAVRRAWRAVREDSAMGSAWRFAVAAILPSLLLLSAAKTGRGIYAAPLLPWMGLMLGLWASERAAHPDRFEMRMLRWTVWLTAALVVLGLVVLAPMNAAATAAGIPFLRTGSAVILGSAVAAAALYVAWRALRSDSTGFSIGAIYAAFAFWLCAIGIGYFPVFDRLHDLPSIARAAAGDLGDRKLVLYRPDETTLAFVDMTLGSEHGTPIAVRDEKALRELLAREPDTRALLLLRDRAQGPMREWVQGHGIRLREKKSATATVAALCASGFSVENSYALPDGRRYALLGLARQDGSSQGSCRGTSSRSTPGVGSARETEAG